MNAIKKGSFGLVGRRPLAHSAHITHAKPTHTVRMLGRHVGPHKDVNWSFLPFQQKGDAEKNLHLASLIAEVAKDHGIQKIYAPSPDFSARFVPKERLTTAIELGNGVSLLRNPAEPADVTSIIIPGTAVAVTTGGCPMVVIEHYKGQHLTQLLVAHAGRDALLPRGFINNGLHGNVRLHHSVVDTLMEKVSYQTGEIHVTIYASVPGPLFPHHLEEGVHAEYNKAMRKYILSRFGATAENAVPVTRSGVMHLDLPKLIEAQLLRHGVPAHAIDMRFAYLNPERAWHDGTPRAPRNLFLAYI